jgi:hypothetical protein
MAARLSITVGSFLVAVTASCRNIQHAPLKPEPQPRDKTRFARVFARVFRQILRITEAARPLDTHVRGEFAPDLVAQAQACGEIGQTAAHTASGVALAIGIRFYARLQNQLLR